MARELAPILADHVHVVCAVAPNLVRVDTDTEDGGVVVSMLTAEQALAYARDLARAARASLRMID